MSVIYLCRLQSAQPMAIVVAEVDLNLNLDAKAAMITANVVVIKAVKVGNI